MVMHTEGQRPAQLGFSFPERKQKARFRAPSVLDSSKSSSSFRLKGEISAFFLNCAERELSRLIQGIWKANPIGAPYFQKELLRIYNASQERQRIKLESLPTPEQAKEAQDLLIRLRYLYSRGAAKKEDSFKWRAVPQEEQDAAYALEHHSNICIIAGLGSLLLAEQYSDLSMVLGLAENEAVECAKERWNPSKPRISGHMLRFLMEMRSRGIFEKAESLAETEFPSQ